MPSLLTSVRARVIIDVDSMNAEFAKRHSSEARFCDMTSNQGIAYAESIRPEQASILAQAIKTAQTQHENVDEEAIIDHAVDFFTVLLAKAVYPHLTGRVHAQTTPASAYDTEKTVAHARQLVSLFEGNGIPKDRVCIKIPTTPESIIACQQLEREGIRTLATCLFSVPQALAASQAGCLYIAPYFNELRVHFEPEIWKKYEDTAMDHPAALVIKEIVSTYRAIGSRTLVMPASIVTVEEVIALVSLQPDHLTLSGTILDKLAALPESELPDPIQLPTESPLLNTDYLKDGGSNLRAAIVDDAETARKLADALKLFDEMEYNLKALIRSQLKP